MKLENEKLKSCGATVCYRQENKAKPEVACNSSLIY